MKTHEINKIRPFSALIDACWWEPYSLTRLLKDAIAGVTVGIIAIPLAMALAIASGVPPQYGLYTAAIAGIVIAVSGGSRYSVSGPTAAFVVILYPVSQQFGLAGLLVATLISGVFLLLMGLARFGRLIEYIPLPVTLGFTSGIAITIATMQIKDFFGLQLAHTPENYVGKLYALLQALPTLDFGDTLIGAVTLLILIFWPKLGLRVHGHLPALLAGTALMGLLALFDHPVATIGSRFSYLLADGSSGRGILPILPQLLLPPGSTGRRRAAVHPELANRFRPAAGGVFDGDARRDRIAAVRSGTRRHDRQETQLEQRADRRVRATSSRRSSAALPPPPRLPVRRPTCAPAPPRRCPPSSTRCWCCWRCWYWRRGSLICRWQRWQRCC